MATDSDPKADVLTPIQRKVYDLCHTDWSVSFKDAARRLGISGPYTHRVYQAACKKLGVEQRQKTSKPNRPQGVETLKPEQASRAIINLSLPAQIRPSLEQIAADSGLGERAIKGLSSELKTQMWPLKQEIREIAMHEYARLLQTQAWNIACSIDQETIEAAGLKDRAVAIGILTDKALLVQGKPTEVHAHEVRGKLDDVLGAVAQALQRRGLTLPAPTITVPSEAVT